MSSSINHELLPAFPTAMKLMDRVEDLSPPRLLEAETVVRATYQKTRAIPG